MSYSETNLSGERLNNNTPTSLYVDIIDKVSNYLELYDKKMTENSFGDEEDDSSALNDFFSKLHINEYALNKENVHDELESLVKSCVAPIVESRLLTQKNTLKNHKALLRHGQKGELEWFYLTNGTIPSEEHLKAVESLTSDYIADMDWLEECRNRGVDIVDIAESKILQKVENILKLMEASTPWGGMLSGGGKINLEKYVSYFVNGILDLASICNNLDANRAKYLFSFVKDDPKFIATLKEIATDLVDEQLANINDAYLPEVVSRKDKKARKSAAYAVNKTVRVDDDKESLDINYLEAEIVSFSAEEDNREVDLGEYDFEFPWMKSGVQSSAKLYKGDHQNVVLVKAMAPKLEKISELARDGLKKNSDGEDKIDITIKQIVKRLSDGIMPYEYSNSVKGLKTESKDMRDQYKEEKIWYSFDISPNSPRVYFTIKQVPEFIMQANKSIMLVVLAESDKARQIDTLTRLTKLDRSTLRARGAGSV